MHVLLLTKYFFLLVFLVIYTESHIVIPAMEPNPQEVFIAPGDKLDIECNSTRKIKLREPVGEKRLSSRRVKLFFEEKENGLHIMKIQINKTQYVDIGLFGCGHDKIMDNKLYWLKAGLISPVLSQLENIFIYEKQSEKSYIEVKKNDPFQITCNNTGKMIIRRYISPWLCCILSIENEPNETDTIMIYKEDRRNRWTQGLYGCNRCEKYINNFMNAKISQNEINGTFILNLEKKKAVLGDTGWYACDNLKNTTHPLIHWTYVYVKPDKYLFVDINDFKAITVDVNKTLTIPCRPKSPNYQVTLYANGKKINDNGNVIFNNSLGFIIDNVQLEDNGYYECRITLDGITEEKGFDVLVTEPNNLKPTMYPDLSYIELEENQLLNLTCTSTQRPYFFVNPWMLSKLMNFDTKPLEEETHEEADGIHTSKLQVKTSSHDTGFYGCVNFKLDYMDSENNDRALELDSMNIRWIYVYVKEDLARVQYTVVAFPSSDIRSTLEESNPHLEIRNMTNIFGDISKGHFIVTIFALLSYIPERNIRFTVYNDVGNDSIVVSLFPNGKPPEFGIIGPNKNVVVGEALELICIGRIRDSVNKIKWTNINDSEIRSSDADPRINIKFLEHDNVDISILTISSVQKSDEYKYYCKIENAVYNYKLNVNELKKPNCTHTNMNKTEVKYETFGKSTVLKCYVDGVPEPTITWSKNNVQINTTYPNMPNDICKYEFDHKDQELYIGYLHESCFGNYSCKADNNLGHWETYQQIVIEDPTIKIFGVTSALIITTIILIYFFIKFKKEKNLRKQLMEGNLQPMDPELTVNEQVDLLSYDKSWEFPSDKLKLGKILGRGQFGIVIKAEAQGICAADDKTTTKTTTVAIKTVKKPTQMTNIQALASELKIMIYIGEHKNIINLLGACTKNIAKRELLVIVEYCQFGDLHNYLIKHRLKFINQINPLTGKINIIPVSCEISTALKHPTEMSNNITLNKVALYSEDCLDDYNKDQNLQTICTQDLFSWSLQVAQGMEYLSKKKVLHGDLAARNILLAQNNIVKISDFGLAKNIYSDGIYEKKGDAPLPVKWMAIDSLEGKIFTTQSDVWSFGIVLWEFFSLAETPYPEMDAKDCWLNVRQGYRMEKPKYATNEIYNIMFKCWLENPTLRPTFTDLVNDIGDLLDNIDKKDSTYLNTPFVDIKKRLDDGKNNDYLIMNPAPDHPALSSSKSDYVNDPTININTNLSRVYMNSTNKKS